MFDPATRARLRVVHEEVCERISRREISARTHVAAKLLQAATEGQTSLDDLRQAGCRALSEASSMQR